VGELLTGTVGHDEAGGLLFDDPRRQSTATARFQVADRPFAKNEDPFSAVIRCTGGCDVDKKTISKWARALRYASRRKEPDMLLKTFMKKAGGVNSCANLYAKHLGRGRRRPDTPEQSKR
jgi:hypothetical protein